MHSTTSSSSSSPLIDSDISFITSSSSSSPSSSSLFSVLPLQFRLKIERYKWLVFATLVNYVTYSSWTLLNKYQFSAPAMKNIQTSDNDDSLHQNQGNKKIVHHIHDGLGVDCPVFSTGLQMLLAGSIACAVSILVNKNGKVLASQSSSGVFTLLKTQILPLGISRAIDIGCGNAALALVSVALQQILKSLLPLFVCLLSYFVLGKKVSSAVWLSLIPIVAGSLLAAMPAATNSTASEKQSSSSSSSFLVYFGIVLALVSTFGRSMKAVLNAKLLSGSQKSLPLAPLEVLSLEAPTSGILLLIGSLAFGAMFHSPQSSSSSGEEVLNKREGICNSVDSFAFIRVNIFTGILMFFNQLSYITVIKLSSALSCQVLMNLKMSLLIIVSILLFATPLSGTNMMGMLIAFVGCLYYAMVAAEDERLKEKMRKQEQNIVADDDVIDRENSPTNAVAANLRDDPRRRERMVVVV